MLAYKLFFLINDISTFELFFSYFKVLRFGRPLVWKMSVLMGKVHNVIRRINIES